MRADRHRRQAALAAVVAVFIAGCGGDSGTVPTRLQVRVFATPASIPVSGASTIIAQVTTDQAQPASGHTIEWSNSLATLQVRGGATDASGRTTATLRGQGEPGVAVITASVLGSGERGQVEVRIGLD
jgi:hypothetical protein